MIISVTKNRLFETIYQQMITLIEDGLWKEGERIPGEVELASQFQVSRNSLRTAIKVLHTSEILESKPGVGTYVCLDAIKKLKHNELMSMMQDDEYAEEIIEVRTVLDKEIAYIAANKRTDEDLEELENCIDFLSIAVENGDTEKVIYWGSRFHTKIVKITGNRIMINLYESLKPNLDTDRKRYLNRKGLQKAYDGENGYIKHDRKILEALRNKDGDAARNLMVEHMSIRREKESRG